MHRPILVCTLLFLTAASLAAQDANQSNAYQGTSNPPADDTIVTADTAQAKPPAGHRYSPAVLPAAEQAPPSAAAAVNDANANGGVVAGQQGAAEQQGPTLIRRPYAADPDGDIVHPHPLRPGELPQGTNIRVRLLDRLSTVSSEKGEEFRSTVASDVLLGDKVVIPAGTEIDGRVAQVSSGKAGGHGSMYLLPETVIKADGSRYQLRAELTQTPGSKTRMGSEGAVVPGSRMKRDEIEYGATVGAGAAAGAMIGGPIGALAGGMVGAGVITVHLLVNHPQATLEPGTAMLFTLTQPLELAPENATAVKGNE